MKTMEALALTPKLLAEGFWELDNSEQSEFFEELYNILDGLDLFYESDIQWYYMAKDMEKNEKAKKMACAMMVHIFNYTPDYLEHTPA